MVPEQPQPQQQIKNSVPLENILEAAGWKSDYVFVKYYNKVVSKKSFAQGVLETCQ